MIFSNTVSKYLPYLPPIYLWINTELIQRAIQIFTPLCRKAPALIAWGVCQHFDSFFARLSPLRALSLYRQKRGRSIFTMPPAIL